MKETNTIDFIFYINRGNAYRNLNLYDKAFESYNKAIELKPDDFRAYVNRGIVFN